MLYKQGRRPAGRIPNLSERDALKILRDTRDIAREGQGELERAVIVRMKALRQESPGIYAYVLSVIQVTNELHGDGAAFQMTINMLGLIDLIEAGICPDVVSALRPVGPIQ